MYKVPLRTREGPLAVRSLVAPWPGKNGRVLTCLGERAGAEYAEVVGEVAAVVEAALDPGVHGGRVLTLRPLRLSPWRAERVRYRKAALELAASSRVAVALDVDDCYRSIDRRLVTGALRAIGVDEAAVSAVDRFLRRVSEAGILGLPVGPEPSAVLANAVLRAIDEVPAELGLPHLRWSDDILLFADSLQAALTAREAVDDAVRAAGLRLHPTKRRTVVGPRAIRRLVLSGWVGSGTSV